MKQRMLVTAMGLGLAAMMGSASAAKAPEGERVWIGVDRAQQQSLQNTLRREGATIHYEFAELGAIVATLPQASIQRLSANSAVRYIEPDHPRYPMGTPSVTVPYGIDLIHARDVWDADRDGVIDKGAPTGAGVTVCVIDSGLTVEHDDFQGLDIVGGYPANWNHDMCGHGTHVAGTIAANNDGGIVGVSPGEVSLYIVKVFGNQTPNACGWTYSSSLVDAANRCAENGATVINMSLGGGSSSIAEGEAFAALADDGIISIAAAGNGGNTAYSFPASYDAVVSVGGVDINKASYTSSQRNSQVEVSAPAVAVVSSVGFTDGSFSVGGSQFEVNGMGETVEATVSGTLVDGGLCLTPVAGATGAIVLCQRGEISFADKGENAEAGGAVGVAIYNNASGNFSGTFGDDNKISIPGVSLSLEDGTQLVSGNLGQNASLSTEFTYPATGYASYNGTSMASPHVAAAAAVLLSQDPSLTPAQIRAVLANTAEDLGAPGRDNTFGYGLIDLKAAVDMVESGDIPDLPEDPELPPTEALELENGVTVNVPDIAADGWAMYYIDLPEGNLATRFELAALADTTGDADLYVRQGQQPTLTDFDCRSWAIGNNELCEVAEGASLPAGRYYIGIHAYPQDGTVSNVALTVSYEGGDVPPDGAPTNLVANELFATRSRATYRLEWTGGDEQVDIYRDGRRVTTTSNTGSYAIALPRPLTGHEYRVCNAGTDECSGSVTPN